MFIMHSETACPSCIQTLSFETHRHVLLVVVRTKMRNPDCDYHSICGLHAHLCEFQELAGDPAPAPLKSPQTGKIERIFHRARKEAALSRARQNGGMRTDIPLVAWHPLNPMRHTHALPEEKGRRGRSAAAPSLRFWDLSAA